MIDPFLTNFFVRKYLATSADARRRMANLKMFYRRMLDEGRIDPADYDLMLQTLDENGREYIRLCDF